MDKKKLWAPLSYKTADLLVSTGYYLGALPVYWDTQANKMVVVTSRVDKLRWLITIGFMMFWKISIAIAFIVQFYKHGFEADDPSKVFHCMSSGVAIALGLFDLHTARNFNEFVSFINITVAYYEYFQNMFARKEVQKAKEDKLCGIIKVCFFLGSIALSVGLVFLYLIRCDIHYLDLVLGSYLCSEPPLIVTILAAIFQFYYTAILCFSMVLYVDLFSGIIIFGMYVLGELANVNSHTRTCELLQTHTSWNHTYRCCQLTVIHVNQCLESLLPTVFLLTISLSVLLIYILIRLNMGILMTLLQFTLLGLLAIFFLVFVKKTSLVTALAQAGLDTRVLSLTSKYLLTYHKSLSLLKIPVGSFFDLDRQAVPVLFAVIIDYTVNLLLL